MFLEAVATLKTVGLPGQIAMALSSIKCLLPLLMFYLPWNDTVSCVLPPDINVFSSNVQMDHAA